MKASAQFDLRRARLKDAPALAQLLAQLFEQEAEFRPQAKLQLKGLCLLLKPGSPARIYVACVAGQVKGMVSLLPLVSTALGCPVAMLEDLVVDKASRGCGMGAALLDHALLQARRSKLGRVTLLTDPGNRRALALYRSRGFKPSPMRALRWLPPD